jgi:hypothetical protein
MVAGVCVAGAIGWMGELDGAEKGYCSIGSGGSYPDGGDGHVDFYRAGRYVEIRDERGKENKKMMTRRMRPRVLMAMMRGTLHPDSGGQQKPTVPR